jgi:hypothetical protein
MSLTDEIANIEDATNKNDNWYFPPIEGEPMIKTGTVESFKFDPLDGMYVLLRATHQGKDDVLFALYIDRETDTHDYSEKGTLHIECDPQGADVFVGEILDTTAYEDDDEYEAKVVTMDVYPENGNHYKVVLDLNEGGMDFSVEMA